MKYLHFFTSNDCKFNYFSVRELGIVEKQEAKEEEEEDEDENKRHSTLRVAKNTHTSFGSKMATEKTVKLPWHVTDHVFVADMKRLADVVESLDCSDCPLLSQQCFLQLSREKVFFKSLKRLSMPETGVFPDLVYECLGELCPKLEEIVNVRQNCNNSCNQLKCYSNFNNLKIVYDNPVANYGRMSNPSKGDKQRRKCWEQDVAKIAINCQKVETYVCNGGKWYLDDKSLERVAVLMPCLEALELKRCSASDEGICKFFSLHRSKNLKKLTLDEAGINITDATLNLVSEHCPSLRHLRLMRNDNYTKPAVMHLIKSCTLLTEFSFDGRQQADESVPNNRSFDEDSIHTLSIHSPHLTTLKLYRCELSFKKVSATFSELRTLHTYDCAFSHAAFFLDFLTTLPSLNDLSFVDCAFVSPDFVVELIIKLINLSRLTLFCRHRDFYSDVSNLAKEAYTKLTGENGGRFKLSGISHLSLQGVSSAFLRLVTALCSQATHLDFRHTAPVLTSDHSFDPEDLVETLSSCELLKHLEFTSTATRPCVTDAFFNHLCTTSLESLYVDFSLKRISRGVAAKVLRTAPFLQHLTLDITEGDIDDKFLKEVVDGCREKRWMRVVEEGNRKLVKLKISPLVEAF